MQAFTPFEIFNDTYLEQISTQWTPVGEDKHYRCAEMVGTDHTRFLESDRSTSIFAIHCQSDGTFAINGTNREEWPTCVKDIQCSLPPEIPTSEEYTLPADYGKVHIEALIYPNLTDNGVMTSFMYNHSAMPRNYNANLSYNCGKARHFSLPNGSFVDQFNMTCQWNKTWSPSNSLPPCQWKECLQPTPPPSLSNLRLADWNGAPISFGESMTYVCDRGLMFDHDPYQKHVVYSCQDGYVTGTTRGFFNTPNNDADWPFCIEGKTVLSVGQVITLTTL